MVEVKLSQGYVAFVDDQDAWVTDYSWHVFKDKSGLMYARRSCRVGSRGQNKVITVRMHREILDVGAHQEVDHRDGDGLNNRRDNLRIATRSQNTANQRKRIGTSSQYKGVTWVKSRNKWCAAIRINGKHVHLGHFDLEVDAARVYDVRARMVHGEFALTNDLTSSRRMS